MVGENKTTPPKAEDGKDNTEVGNEQAERKEKVREVIQEVLKKAESDLNNLKELTDEIKVELNKRGIEIPDDIDDAVNEAVEKFGEFKDKVSGNETKPKIEKIITDPDEQIKAINYWLTSAENCTDMATAKLHLEVVEEELVKAKSANIDTSQIANLEERIEKIKEKVNSENKEKERKGKTQPAEMKEEIEEENERRRLWTELDEKGKIKPDETYDLDKLRKMKADEEIDEKYSGDKERINQEREEAKAKPKPKSENLNTNQTETAGATGEEEEPEAKTTPPETEKIIPEPESKPEPKTEQESETEKETKTEMEAEGEILRNKIKDVVFGEREKKDWTDEEKKIMEAYILGVKRGNFKEKDVNLLAVDFDLENVQFERSSPENKKAKIEERKEKYKNELIASGAIEPEGLNDRDKLEEVKKLLKERVKEESEAYNKLIEDKYRAGENPFSKENKHDLKEVIEKIKESHETELKLEKLEYYQLAVDDAQLEFMINEHHIKINYTIRMLEQALEAYDKVLELLSIEEEKLTPEQQGILTKLFELMKKNPKSVIAILAILVASGLLIAYGPAILASLGSEAANEIGQEVVKKAAESSAGKAVGYGAGLAGAVGLGLLGGAIYTLTDEKQRDEFMEWLTGTKVMFGAGSERKK